MIFQRKLTPDSDNLWAWQCPRCLNGLWGFATEAEAKAGARTHNCCTEPTC